MDYFKIVESDWWQACLPGDWIQDSQGDNDGIRFQSGDGEKAISITTWLLKEGKFSSAIEAAENSKLIQLAALNKMPDHKWTLVNCHVVDSGDTATITTDNFSPKQNYRIACKIFASESVLINAFFHDYYCLDYSCSKQFFDPIIESLKPCIHKA